MIEHSTQLKVSNPKAMYAFNPQNIALLFKTVLADLPASTEIAAFGVYAARDVIGLVESVSNQWANYLKLSTKEAMEANGLFGVLYDERLFPLTAFVQYPVDERMPAIEDGAFAILLSDTAGNYYGIKVRALLT